MKFIVLLRVTLVMTFVVIMLGAYTRLADAGLGCLIGPVAMDI